VKVRQILVEPDWLLFHILKEVLVLKFIINSVDALSHRHLQHNSGFFFPQKFQAIHIVRPHDWCPSQDTVTGCRALAEENPREGQASGSESLCTWCIQDRAWFSTESGRNLILVHRWGYGNLQGKPGRRKALGIDNHLGSEAAMTPFRSLTLAVPY